MPIEPTRTNVAHLLRRAAWGGLPDEIESGVDAGIEATVDRLLDPSSAPRPTEPQWGSGDYPYSGETLATWFYELASSSPTPAIERLMWVWHGHFATSFEKVEWVDLLLRQLLTLRRLGLGRFDDLLLAVVHDPAMNLYLDLHLSVVGAPNENFARELMELFSLGAGQGYTQPDVVQVGRALTGYGIDDHPVTYRPWTSRLMPVLHDYGDKTIFGQTGAFDAADVVAMITEKPECHRFITQRLWLRYAGAEPAPDVVADLSRRFGERLRVDDLLRAMWTHPSFYATEVQNTLVQQPVESLVRAARALELRFPEVLGPEEEMDYDDAPGLALAELSWRMGQQIGAPPNVGGWPHGDVWLDASRATGRLRAGQYLGELVAWSDTAVARALADDVGDPPAFTARILGRFGAVAWSEETELAIASALDTDEPESALAAAIAVAFVSPEVTLA